MTVPLHHVIIGGGSAGYGAAMALRARDALCRISMITMDHLPFYNRYDLPRVFRGCHDWRDLLAVAPAQYDVLNIQLRRASRVIDVRGADRTVTLSHQETLHYDRLLVCTGGRAYLPENLGESAGLINGFGSFEAAMRVWQALPGCGTVIMIGGDMIGIDLALTLLDTGYHVTLIANPQTFWPHVVAPEKRQALLAALAATGVTVIDGNRPVGVAAGPAGKAARTVTLEDGAEITGDVVMAFCGIVPSVEFMLGAGIDIERGILVDPHLHTTDENIWAAGDVCQIWNDKAKTYNFYHGWNNVRIMGELAARNMSGADEVFDVNVEDRIEIDAQGQLRSTFWTH